MYSNVLKSFFFSFNFHKFCQSGFYLDFFVKKQTEVFLKNIFIYSAQFFGEKYMIELWTKKVFKILVTSVNKTTGVLKLTYSLFFIQILNIFLYIFAIILLLL